MDRIPLNLLDELEGSHDGPPPWDAVRTAVLGGSARTTSLGRAAASALHSRLAAEARLGAARRRRVLSASGAPGDVWLTRLAATVAHHRRAAADILFKKE